MGNGFFFKNGVLMGIIVLGRRLGLIVRLYWVIDFRVLMFFEDVLKVFCIGKLVF